MSPKDEEEIFNKLMEEDDEIQEKKRTPDVEFKKYPTKFPYDDSDSSEVLLEKYGALVEKLIKEIKSLRQYLIENLGNKFSKMRGAWEQYVKGEIEISGLVTSGIYVLRQDFLSCFIEFAPPEEQPLLVKSQSKESEPKPAEISPTMGKSSSKLDMFAVGVGTPAEQQPIEEAAPEKPKPKVAELKIQAPEKPKPKPVEPEVQATPQVKIPSFFLGDTPEEKPPEKVAEPVLEKVPEKPQPVKLERLMPEKPKGFTIGAVSSEKPKSTSIEAFGSAKPKVKPIEEKEKLPTKIEHVMPKGKTRTRLESIHAIGTALEEIKAQPTMAYEKIDDMELRSVNVGASLSDSPLFDEFEQVENMLHNKQYQWAETKIKELKDIAEARELQYAVDRAEDLLTNIGFYKMIPQLIEDAEIAKDPKRAKEKLDKAMKLAKMIGDTHYISDLGPMLNTVNEKLIFQKKKVQVTKDKDIKLRNLIRNNIKRMGKEESLASIDDIKKYCQVNKPAEFIFEILKEMIEQKEIYAKLFPESQKVMFDKESNKLFVKVGGKKL